MKKGDLAFEKSLFLDAEDSYRKATEQYKITDRQKYFRSQNKLGDVLRLSGKEHEAERLLRKGEFQLQKEFPNSILLAECYDILGELYFYISDVERAGNYFKEALVIKQRLLKENDARLAFSISNVGRYYNFKQKHELALKYTRRAFDIIESEPTHLSEIIPELIYCEYAYTIKGLQVEYTGDQFYEDVPRPIYFRAIQKHRERRKEESYWLAYLHHYLGNTYTDQLAHAKNASHYKAASPVFLKGAFSNYLKAERIYKKFLPRHNPRLSMTYYVMGLANDYSAGDPRISIQYYDKALYQALPAATSGESKELLNAFNQHHVLSLVSWKIKSYHDIFKVDRDRQYGEEVLRQTDILYKVWLKMLSEYQLNKYYGITTFYYRVPFESALEVCYELGRKLPNEGYQEKALVYIELSKLSQRKKFEIKNETEARDFLRDYRAKIAQKVKTLPEHSAVVEYYDPMFFSNDKDTDNRRMFIAVVTKGQVKLLAKEFSKSETAEFASFFTNIASHDVRRYREYTFKLYRKLLGFELDPSVKSLRIIPGVTFSYQIPFSALATSTEGSSFKTIDYVLNKYTISSSLSLMGPESASVRTKKKILYVSPANGNYAALPFSQLLIDRLAEEYPGNTIQGADGRANVLREFQNFDIIHLATHGVANDRDPDSSYLVFADRKVYSSELYQLNLKADLVNLSACETVRGVSSEHNGSVINFLRAFDYAGAKSITSTLWKVDDEMTSKIYKDFFDGLAAGRQKDISLQKQQLTRTIGPVWCFMVRPGRSILKKNQVKI